MLEGAGKIYLGSVPVKKVMLGSVMIHPAVVSVARNVHYDTGTNTYQGWDRYNIYYYHDVLTWSDGLQTFENEISENTLTKTNAYIEANTLKSQGTTFWRSGWDKYKTDIYQTYRTREDGYTEWVGELSSLNVLVQSNAYTQVRTLKSTGSTYWPSGWDKYRTDIYQDLRVAFDGYQEWVGAEEQVDILVQTNAYTLGVYYVSGNTPTVCINYGVAPYQTGYHRIMSRNKVRFDGYSEVNNSYTESEWQIVSSYVTSCGYTPPPPVEVWGEWVGTGESRCQGYSYQLQRQRESNLGNIQYGWITLETNSKLCGYIKPGAGTGTGGGGGPEITPEPDPGTDPPWILT